MDNPNGNMIELREVTKRYGDFIAVANVDLQLKSGEFITLLGPSGCGKTTMLRLISGFETPTEGAIFLNGEDVTDLPPYRRNVNQVFQSYALFPHLSVRDNIAFGLRMQKVPKRESDERVQEAIDMVSLGALGDRRPSQLSGGQRQRVALARAIVCRPKVLLLDEPLSALDAKLRHQMQIELKRLQKKLGITFLFVTHDQEEALTMSDRIAVINHGKVEQLGEVSEIYHAPRTRFVASFIGQANIIESSVLGFEADHVRVKIDGGIALRIRTTDLPAAAKRVLISIRPEKIHLQKTRPEGDNVFAARVSEEIFRGAMAQLTIGLDSGLELSAVVTNESATQERFREGDHVFCHLHPSDIVVVSDETEDERA